MKRFIALLVLILILSLCTACEYKNGESLSRDSINTPTQPDADSSNSQNNQNVCIIDKAERTPLKINDERLLFMRALIDGKIIYSGTVNASDEAGDELFVVYDLQTKKNEEVGVVKNSHVDSDDTAILGNRYSYFSKGIMADGNNNILFRLDIREKILKEISSEYLYPPFSFFRKIDDSHFLCFGSTLPKGVEEGDNYENYFRIYSSPDDKIIAERRCLKEETGIYQTSAVVRGDEIFIYTLQNDSFKQPQTRQINLYENETELYIYVYDMSFNFKRKISLSGLKKHLINEDGEETSVWVMYCKNDYFVFTIVGGIQERVAMKYDGENFVDAADSPYSSLYYASYNIDTEKFPYLYLYPSQILNVNTGEVKHIQFDIDDKYKYIEEIRLADSDGNILIEMRGAAEDDVDNQLYHDIAYFYIKAEDIIAALNDS